MNDQETTSSVATVHRIDQITAGWLSEALRGAGFERATVSDFEISRVGTGQAAICCRIGLQYENPQSSLPKSIVAKFPAEDSASREAGKNNGTYLREVNFYRLLRDRLLIRTPRCYFAQINADGPEFALLLEDLAPAEQGDQIRGCSPTFVRAAVLNLVGLHAPSWQNSSMLSLNWLGSSNRPGRSKSIMQIYKKGLPLFLERCADGLSVEETKLLRRIAEEEDYPSEFPLIKNYCLTHNDFRADNMLVDESRGMASLHVVDWQTFGVGNPMKDVSYFVGGCLLPEQRLAFEQEIVREYHQRMLGSEVKDYDWETCWSDYRRFSFHGIMMAVAGMMFVTKTERGDRLFSVMAQRHTRQALDVGAHEFLG